MNKKAIIKELVDRMAFVLKEYPDGLYAQKTLLEMYQTGLEDMYEAMKTEIANDEMYDASIKTLADTNPYKEIEVDGEKELVYSYWQMHEQFKRGAKWRREEMLKDALEATVEFDFINGDFTYGRLEHQPFPLENRDLKEGDSVRVIILKDE